jgi:hypothetical protein
MPTTPTQMRLTPSDLKRLDRIKRILRCGTRTSTIRDLIEYFMETSGINASDASEKKSKK